MGEWEMLGNSYDRLLDDIAHTINRSNDSQVAAKEAVQCVAKWLVAPSTDLCLPEQMQFSNHSTALLLTMGQPIDE